MCLDDRQQACFEAHRFLDDQRLGACRLLLQCFYRNLGGQRLRVLGVPLSNVRGFTPSITAGSTALWQSVARGEVTVAYANSQRLQHRLGATLVAHGARGTAVRLRVGAFATIGLPGAQAMVSTVAGDLRPGCGWPELLDATFPPGSVTGAPKLAAVDLIRRLEPVPRGPYCGAVGWVDADRRQGELNVAIRTFWVDDGELCLGTGGAITWDSTADGEWAETELKAARVLAVASPEPNP